MPQRHVGSGPPTAPTRGRRASGPRFVLLGFLAVALLGAASCGGSTDTTAASDVGAARQLSQAALAMQHASGYRFVARVGSAPGQVQLTGEFQAPDRVHETVTVAGKPSAEVIFIGSQAFVKDPTTGVWRNRVAGATAMSTDVRAAFAALTHARTVTRHGATYWFTVPAAQATQLVGLALRADVPASAHLTNGQIQTLTYSPKLSGRTVAVQVTYSDVNHAPAVEPPAVS